MLSKKCKAIFVIIFLISTILFSPFVIAQSGTDYFKLGIKAAKSDQYSVALKHFQNAKKAGLNSLALQYNFGVVYYKLGQYEKAKKVFTALIKVKKYEQFAFYNLGLVANKQKNRKVAIKWFQQSLTTGESDKLKILSREALKRLGVDTKRSTKPRNKWQGLLSASLSSDSNVTLVNDDLAGVSNQSDNSMVLSAYSANWLNGGKADGIRFFLRGYMQKYSTETNYNYTQLGLGGAKYKQLGGWDTRVGGFLDETYLGGSTYQRIISAEARAHKALSKNTQFRMRYKVSSIDVGNAAYEYLGGMRQQFRVGLKAKNKTSRYRMYYQLEQNDRDDYENPAGTVYVFKSYSPARHTFRLTATWDVSSLWKLRLDGRYRSSKYKDDHILVSSATERREDTQTRYSVRLSRKIDKNLQLEMTHTNTNNDSSIDSESYDHNLTNIGLTWRF